MTDTATDETIKGAVRQAYGDIARRFVEEPAQASCCGPSEATVEKTTQASCCGPSETTVEKTTQASCCGPSEATDEKTTQASCCGPSEATDEKGAQASCCGSSEAGTESAGAAVKFYSAEELTDLPDSVADISLGCGNPTAIAGLQPGEVVLDLGSGGGIDCFLAAKKVGPEGRVIGLDMTPDMIRLARRNAKKIGATNVDFRYAEMEDIPLPDETVNVIISNCVINLSPDKDAVFGEAYRVLQPGGRMAVSDIVIDGELPQSIRSRLDAWAGCIAGALDESDYLAKIRAAGFEEVEVLSRNYVKISEATDWEGVQELLKESGFAPQNLDHTVASITIAAYKAD